MKQYINQTEIVSEDALAIVDYQGLEFVAAAQRANVTGLQFHPELSGKVGLEVLRQFLSI